jgi:AbrB family looped-hinge helix DNA binding protein
MGYMRLQVGAMSASFHVGAKGRVVLPAAVRRAAHVEEGDEVVARADGDGRVVIETVSSIRARVWAAAPEGSGVDTEADVRAMRDQDRQLEHRRAADNAVALRTEQQSAEAGAALLAHLGL